MTDDGIPFVLVGIVHSWDPATRVLWVGGQRFSIAPTVPADFLTRDLSITITGTRPREGEAPWTVAAIRPQEPGFGADR